MSEQDTTTEAATYDVEGAQERWRRVWDELDPFRAADDGS